jgi:hypothetical protein
LTHNYSDSSIRSKRFEPSVARKYFKLVGDDAEPLMPEDLAKAIKEVARDREGVETLKSLSGAGSLPPR